MHDYTHTHKQTHVTGIALKFSNYMFTNYNPPAIPILVEKRDQERNEQNWVSTL